MSGDPGTGSLSGQILLIVVLTAVNAFFAAAEMAIVSVNRKRIEQEAQQGDKKAQALLGVMNDSSSFLATIQLAITFAGFLSSASAATSLTQLIKPMFGNAAWAEEVSLVMITLILSYVSLVFGELYPKQISLARSEQVAKLTIGPVKIVRFVMRPLVWLLSISTQVLVKLTPLDLTPEQNKMTRDEMIAVIQDSRKTGVINPDQYSMLEGIITFNDKMAREVMVPRTDAFMIDILDSDEENLDEILQQPYSRIPVYREEKDQVVGVIHIKKILQAARHSGFHDLKIAAIMSDPLFVPETISINDLLLEMQKTHQQLAILLDEYGGVVGLATIEDLLEEIVGDIDDETDQVTPLLTKLSATSYRIAGKMPIADFNDVFHTTLYSDDVDTIAGFIITLLGTIPTDGEQRTVKLENGMTFTTGKVQGSRLETVLLTLPEDLEVATVSDPQEETTAQAESSEIS